MGLTSLIFSLKSKSIQSSKPLIKILITYRLVWDNFYRSWIIFIFSDFFFLFFSASSFFLNKKTKIIINPNRFFSMNIVVTQAWSNGVYRSVEHRVVTNKLVERFSTAYIFCPSYDTMIQSCAEPSIYKSFSFGEFRKQVQEDVKRFGNKIGLPRFLVRDFNYASDCD